MKGYDAKGAGVNAGRTATALFVDQEDCSRGFISNQSTCGTGHGAGRAPAQAANVGPVHTQGFDLGHVDTGRSDAEPSFMLYYTSHRASLAPATDLVAHQYPLHNSPRTTSLPPLLHVKV